MGSITKNVQDVRLAPDHTTKETFASSEYHILLKDLTKTENDLQGLYEISQDATFKFKSLFSDVQQAENDVELLRQQYYQMLEKKLFDEKCRDSYFTAEQHLADLKDLYIAESQKLAHGNSSYIAYANTFSKQRESCLKKLLDDVDLYYVTCQELKTEKHTFQRESIDLHLTIDKLQSINELLVKERNDLCTSTESLKKECQDLKQYGNKLQDRCHELKTVETNLLSQIKHLTVEQNILKSSLADIEEKKLLLVQELESSNTLQKQMTEKIEDLLLTQNQLEGERQQLQDNNKHLSQDQVVALSRIQNLKSEVLECQATKEKVEEQRDLFKEAFKQVKKEKDLMVQTCEKMQKEKERIKDQYLDLQTERENVGKAKDRIVTREYQTRGRNEDFAQAHKCLTIELEDLQSKFRKSEDRGKHDIKIKQELRDTIKRLHREMAEERKSMIKVTKEIRIQTDPELACENRDIAIQHAKFKMIQALKERDRALKENVKIDKENKRLLKGQWNLLQQIEAKARCLNLARKNEKGLETKFQQLKSKSLSMEKELIIKRKLYSVSQHTLQGLQEQFKKIKQDTTDTTFKKKQVETCPTQTENVIILNDYQGKKVFSHAKDMRERLEQMENAHQLLTQQYEEAILEKNDILQKLKHCKDVLQVLHAKNEYSRNTTPLHDSYLKSVKRALSQKVT